MVITTNPATTQILDLLHTCAEVCIDGERGYSLAATYCHDDALKARFHEYAGQRELFLRELQHTIDDLAGGVERKGTARGAAHRFFVSARIGLEGSNDETILAECERGELGAMAAYDRAIAHTAVATIPSAIRNLLFKQRAALQTAYDDITSEDIRRRASSTAAL